MDSSNTLVIPAMPVGSDKNGPNLRILLSIGTANASGKRNSFFQIAKIFFDEKQVCTHCWKKETHVSNKKLTKK